jgi:chitodextrinase
VHRTVQLEVLNPDDFVTVPGKAWLYDYAADLSDIRCYDYDGFVEPGFNGGGVPDKSGVADPYATGNLLTGSAAPRRGDTGSANACQAVDGD